MLLYRVVLFWVPLVMGVPASVLLRRGLKNSRRPDLCLPVPLTQPSSAPATSFPR